MLSARTIAATSLGADAFGVVAQDKSVAAPGPTQRQSAMTAIICFLPWTESVELYASFRQGERMIGMEEDSASFHQERERSAAKGPRW
jgi:hypothetical protein